MTPPMDYAILTPTPLADIRALASAILAVDPAAVIDLAADGRTVLLATVLGSRSVEDLFAEAGHPLPAGTVSPLASNCCGGCGG